MKKKVFLHNCIWYSAIAVGSVLLFLLYTYSNINSAYADDNILEWGPVIRKCFDSIFAGNGIPYYDFYNYKGLDIFSSGYYGQLNPFMYLSYLISRFLFGYYVNILTVYIIMMYVLGNLVMYRLLSDMGVSDTVKLLSLGAYSSSLIFFEYLYYYFTFNNYFFIPLFVLVISLSKNHCTKWFAPGIILAGSLLLGHIQYSCYYIMVYCIFQVVFAVQDKSGKPLLPMAVNIVIFAVLNSAFLLSLLNASENRLAAGMDINEFLKRPIYADNLFRIFPYYQVINHKITHELFQSNLGLGITCWLCLTIFISRHFKSQVQSVFHFYRKYCIEKLPDNRRHFSSVVTFVLLIPICLLHFGSAAPFMMLIILLLIVLMVLLSIYLLIFSCNLKGRNGKKLFPPVKHLDKITFGIIVVLLTVVPKNRIFIMFVITIIFYVAACIKRDTQQALSRHTSVIHSVLFAAAFFTVFAGGYEGVIAILLSKIPVLNQFRYLYKCAFLYVPLYTIAAAFLLERIRQKGTRKLFVTVSGVSAACSVMTAVTIVYLLNSGLHLFINNHYYFDYFDPTVAQEEVNQRSKALSIDKNYRMMAVSTFEDIIESASQVCTYAFTKNYNVIYDAFTVAGYDPVFSDKSYLQSQYLMYHRFFEVSMSNMSNTDAYSTYCEQPEYLALFEEQMIQNGVKYILYDNDDTASKEALFHILPLCKKLQIVETSPWVRGWSVIELSGVTPIASFGSQQELPMETQIHELRFHTDFTETQTVTVSMTYDKHIIAIITDEQGISSAVPVTENDFGYLNLDIPAGRYQITLTYQNRVMDIAVITAVITAILSAGILLWLLIKKI